jgi:DNA-binding MarR family transcriptional regulator
VSDTLDDTELGRLLTQLLSLVSPAAGDGGARDGGGAAGRAADGAASVAEIPQLSGSEARALIELVKARGIAQGELAGLLGLEKSTVSRLAAGLERKGWIRRGRDEGNQRYVRLYLTAEGGAVAARLWNAWHSRQERILAALTAEERAGLSAGLRGLVRGLAAEGLLGDGPPGPALVPPARPAG